MQELNLSGQKIGKLMIIDSFLAGGRQYWNCKCECGKDKAFSEKKLIRKSVMSCGCDVDPEEGGKETDKKIIDLTGLPLGRLTPIRSKVFHKTRKWLCNCICGNQKWIKADSLLGSGRERKTTDCGCVLKESQEYPLEGLPFGYLTPINFYRRDSNIFWRCNCVCGKSVDIKQRNLLSTNPREQYRSCGCRAYRHVRKKSRDQWGEKNVSWKGGKIKNSQGYILLKCENPNHPRKTQNGYILEHVLVIEQKIDRHVLESETVHHINGIRDDNRIENLELWDNRHPKGQRHDEKADFYKDWLLETEPKDKLIEFANKILDKFT